MPSIWQEELPIWSLVMSLRAGIWVQPLSAEGTVTFRAAPQRGQEDCPPAASAPHQLHRPPAIVATFRTGAGDGAAACATVARGGDGGAAAAAGCFTGEPQLRQKFWPSRRGVPQFTQNIDSLRATRCGDEHTWTECRHGQGRSF